MRRSSELQWGGGKDRRMNVLVLLLSVTDPGTKLPSLLFMIDLYLLV